MAEKNQIIARYTDGVAYYMIGRKIDPAQSLDTGNVKWVLENGTPVIYQEYSDAAKALQKIRKHGQA